MPATAATTPISTIGTYLLYKTASATSWTILSPIKDYPADGASPELLETTDLTVDRATNILGVQQTEIKEFTINYNPSTWTTIKGVCDDTTTYTFAVAFGKDSNSYGHNGGYQWTGQATCWKEGAGVNAVREGKIAISTATSPTDLTSAISTGT